MYEDGENSQQIKMCSLDFVACIFRSNLDKSCFNQLMETQQNRSGLKGYGRSVGKTGQPHTKE